MANLFSGFSAGFLAAAEDGHLRLPNLCSTLRFVDDVYTVTNGIAALVEIHRAAVIASESDAPLLISGCALHCALDLVQFSADALSAQAEKLHDYVNEHAEVRDD